MSKGKDISTMFTREENKKNGRLGYCRATQEKDTIISPVHTQHSCRKEVGENE